MGMMIYTRFSDKETMFRDYPTHSYSWWSLNLVLSESRVYAVGLLVRRSFVCLDLRLLQILAMQECRVNI